jgi:DNA-binding response OmpR family regulator
MSNKKILIVDDDHDVRLAYHIRLKAHHYDTFFATDSLTGITEARKHQPDLIILDLGLPSGDGYLVMERLKANAYLAVIPVIVISARDRRASRERALQAGARAFFQKPVNNDDLLAAIRQCLGETEPTVQQLA